MSSSFLFSILIFVGDDIGAVAIPKYGRIAPPELPPLDL